MESKKVVSLVLVVAMVLIMANLVSCEIENLRYEVITKLLRTHNDESQSSLSNILRQANVKQPTKLGTCAGTVCVPLAPACDTGCTCIPVSVFIGICAGSCCT
ncbi:hypothetical protein FNV43_RR06271 [Rhamnella rubrinervis]|uniref:Uncharacterized protein n=1 Tax=Rhamnella rubrinervis TaxID=2594499 RepID=A0A8K0HD49_9ROSA|nr:hypothetical protein FNV43_RR06271 [Rhamnella rubrinervis]